MATVDENSQLINALTIRLNTIEANSKNIEQLAVQGTLDTASVLMIRLGGISYQVSIAEIIAILNGFEIVEITVNITAAKKQFIKADATSGSFTIDLPLAADNEGQEINIMKIDSSVNTVTVNGNGVESLNGELTLIEIHFLVMISSTFTLLSKTLT